MDFTNLGEGFEQTERQIDGVIDATDRLVGGALERLIDNLSKTANTSQTVSRSLERFANDMLTVFTKTAVESVFDGLSGEPRAPLTRAQSKPSFAEGLLASLVPGLIPSQSQDSKNMGGAGVVVTVNNNAQATANVQERINSRGQREIEVMIDNMVANSLAQGSQTRSVLSSVFGLDNLLKSR